MKNDKAPIKMHVLEEVCEYTFPEPTMAVVMDWASAKTYWKIGSVNAVVVYAPYQSPTNPNVSRIDYDFGSTGWGTTSVPLGALHVRTGDKIRLFFDPRIKDKKMIAVATRQFGVRGQQLYIKPIPHTDADINNFMNRYVPYFSDKVKFNWVLIKTILANCERPHLKPSDNLRHVLKIQGVREQYLTQLAADEHKR